MSKTLLLIALLLISIVWQPVHRFLMTSGVSMSPELHSLITMIPFIAILLFLAKANKPNKLNTQD